MRMPLSMDARLLGTLLSVSALALIAAPPLLASALGLELLALAFWVWARAAGDAPEQVRRWAWLRRPAQAMWLAAAADALGRSLADATYGGVPGVADLVTLVKALAVVWAGLELLAALPLARPYSDLSGPLLAMRPWLPMLLPAAGFALLWRQAPHWIGVTEVRRAAQALLLVTAGLAALRAFGRRQVAPGLRWLAVSDSALAGLLVGANAVSASISLMLWLGVSGGRAFMLAGELRGATPRRGAGLSRLWCAASWTGSAALSWPLLVHAGWGPGTAPHALRFAAVSVPVLLTAWITVRRIVEAPERRQVARRESALSLSHLSAMLAISIGPIALLLAWWSGFEATWPAPLIALAPAAFGGIAALLPARGTSEADVVSRVEALGAGARGTARRTFRFITAIERWLVEAGGRAVAAALAPIRDLHTGDAQEYLLFLVGVSVFALVLPFLR